MELIPLIFIVLAYFAAIGFLIFGIDDVFFDIQFIRYLRKRRHVPHVALDELRAKPEKHIAIFVPAWMEGGVVNRMADYAVKILDYDRFDIFIGVYPNDPETMECVDALAKTCPRIHKVVCPNPGPTSKADCLNAIYHEMRLHEIVEVREYDIIALHDSEDVLHPLTLKVYNFFVPDRVEMGQIPVFPLELPPWKYWVANTYMDDFSELHLKDMLAREEMGGIVPSAGVGTAFSRRSIDYLADHNDQDPFTVGNLTEDYFVGIQLHRAGFSAGFINYPIDRVVAVQDEHGDTVSQKYITEIVAVRENFPSRFWDAVRQRSRWILGISMQCWELAGWDGSTSARYTLFRDRRAPFVHLVTAVGYFVILAWLVEFLFRQTPWGAVVYWPPLFTMDSLLWGLILVDTTFLLYRLLVKIFYVREIYGLKQALFSVPRYPIGNVINFFATCRAVWMYVESRYFERPLVWLKTTHRFPSAEELAEYWTSIGDLIVKDGLVTRERVEAVMQDLGACSLPKRLRELGLLDEKQFVALWSRFSRIPERTVIHSDVDPKLWRNFSESDSHRYEAIPVGHNAHGQLELAFVEPPSAESGAALEALLGAAPARCLITQTNLRILRDNAYAAQALAPFRPSMAEKFPKDDQAKWRAAHEIHARSGSRLADIALDLGLLTAAECRQRWAELFGAEACDLSSERLDVEALEKLGPVFCNLHRFAPLVGDRLVAQELLHPAVVENIHEKLGGPQQFVADLASTTRRFLRDVFKGTDAEMSVLQQLVDEKVISPQVADELRTLRQLLNDPIHVLAGLHANVSESDLHRAFAVVSGLPPAPAGAVEISIDLLRPDFAASTRSRILEAKDGRVTIGLSHLLATKDFSQVCSRLMRYAVRFVLLPPPK